MQTATMPEATRRLARREFLLGGFTFLMAVVGLASLAAVAISGTGVGLQVPGTGAGGGAPEGLGTLVAVGHGEATFAAETATLQLMLGPSDPSMMVSSGSTFRGEADAPGDDEWQAAEPISQAIQTAGVIPEDVSVTVTPSLQNGYYGPSTGYGVRIVDMAGAAAIEGDLRLAQVGVAYAVAECTAVERQAREVAIADAHLSAEKQAELLGAKLGQLVLSGDVPEVGTGGAPASNDCKAPMASASTFPYVGGGGITLPRFDPSQPTEVTPRVRVSLTFALPE